MWAPVETVCQNMEILCLKSIDGHETEKRHLIYISEISILQKFGYVILKNCYCGEMAA